MKKKLFTLMTLLLCICSGAWATNKSYTVQNPESGKRYVQDNIVVAGYVSTSGKIANVSSKKVFYLTSGNYAPLVAISKAKNIKAVQVYGNRATSGSTKTNAFNVETSADAITYSVPTSGFTATATDNGDPVAIESLTNVQMVGNNQSYATTVTVNFTTPVMAVRFAVSQNTHINKIVITYDDAISPETQLCEVHMVESNDTKWEATGCTATVTNIATSSSDILTLTDTEETPNSYYYKKSSGTFGSIDLGTGKAFEEGDEIWIDMSGNNAEIAGTAAGLKFNSSNSAAGAITVNAATRFAKGHAMFIRYVTKSTDPWVGSQKLWILRYDSKDRLYQVTIHRHMKTESSLAFSSTSGSADINAGTSFSLPSFSSKTPSDMTITYSSSNKDVATVNENTGAVTLVAPGETTITASYAGNEEYTKATATYKLTVYNGTHTQFGYTEAPYVSEEHTYLAAYNLTNGGLTDLTLNLDYGSNMTWYATGNKNPFFDGEQIYGTGSAWRHNISSSYEGEFAGYTIAIADDKVLDLSELSARILVCEDTYNWYVEILDKYNNQVFVSDEQTTTKASSTLLTVYPNLSNLTGTIKVRLYVKQGGTSKYLNIERLQLKGKTADDTRDAHTITFVAGTGSGTAPVAITTKDETYTLPAAPLLYKTGYTLTKWNDGSADHAVGTSMDIDDDVTLTAVFEENAAKVWTAPVTAKWTFQTSDGAPTINMYQQAETKVYSKRVVIGETPYDALMTIDASATGAKCDNTANASYAQVNENTKFTIPAVRGMVVTVKTNQPTSGVSDVTFAGNNADEATTYVLTYTYSGKASSIDIIFANSGLYPEYISVAYPILAYNVTYNAGDGSGTVPTETSKAEDAVFTLAKQSTMVAPTGKYFAGWNDGTNDYAGGANYTMPADDVTFTAQWATSAEANHYHYSYKDATRYDGSAYKDPTGATATRDGSTHDLTNGNLCSSLGGITSVSFASAKYDGKKDDLSYMSSYLKIETGTPKVTITIASGYVGTLTLKAGGYSANPTISVSDATLTSGTVGGVATTEDNFNELVYTLTSGTHDITCSGKNMYISEMDLVTTNSISATVQSYGWATYIPAYDVQFADGDAYVVTDINTSTGATKVESVTEVPANTPVLLKGAGEKTITILNTTPAAPATNLMEVYDGADKGTKVPYVLAKYGDTAGFKKWTGAASVITGRAVMWLDSAIATAREFFSLDDVTTGINAIDNELLTIDNNAPMYNLAGQKVSKSYKGIVIVNGKKVLKK